MLSDQELIGLFQKAVMEIEKKTLPNLSFETDLSTLGFDSVTTMEILAEIEDHLDIEFPEEALENVYHMSDLAALIRRLV